MILGKPGICEAMNTTCVNGAYGKAHFSTFLGPSLPLKVRKDFFVEITGAITGLLLALNLINDAQR